MPTATDLAAAAGQFDAGDGRDGRQVDLVPGVRVHELRVAAFVNGGEPVALGADLPPVADGTDGGGERSDLYPGAGREVEQLEGVLVVVDLAAVTTGFMLVVAVA